MRFNRKIILVLLALAIIVSLIIAIWMPFATKISNLDFYVHDSNLNYHYEVNEDLEFIINDSVHYGGRDMVWYFGNGDTLHRTKDVIYTFKEKGKYMITLEVDNEYKISKYLEVISLPQKKALDSIPKINGVDVGYVGEELVFSSHSPGVESWSWEFGETGTEDAYEDQVVYVYREPGNYRVKLKTNTAKYPVYHTIKILPLFEAIEESEPVDSLAMAQNDLRKRFQAIADASIRGKRTYYNNLKHIERRYTCNEADEVVIIVNGDRYNDLYSYCQGLHYLEGKGAKTLVINEVAIDTFNCLKRIEVTQSVINK